MLIFFHWIPPAQCATITGMCQIESDGYTFHTQIEFTSLNVG